MRTTHTMHRVVCTRDRGRHRRMYGPHIGISIVRLLLGVRVCMRVWGRGGWSEASRGGVTLHVRVRMATTPTCYTMASSPSGPCCRCPCGRRHMGAGAHWRCLPPQLPYHGPPGTAQHTGWPSGVQGLGTALRWTPPAPHCSAPAPKRVCVGVGGVERGGG